MSSDKFSNAIFITGISASGKTTLAKQIIKDLRKRFYNVILLDGTDMYAHSILFPFNGHTINDREKRAKHHIRLVKWISYQGILPIVAFIGQPLEIRKLWSEELDDWKEIYLRCDIDTCIQRDNKNLYNRIGNKNKNSSIIGLDDKFNEPKNSWLTINTSVLNVTEVQEKAFENIKKIDWLEKYKLKT